MLKKKFDKLARQLKKTDPSATLLMTSIDLKAVRALRSERGPARRKVLSEKDWREHSKKMSQLFKRYRNKPMPPELFAGPDPVSVKHRYEVSVSFKVPKKVFPMSLDACFSSSVGRKFSDGAGTMLSNGTPRKALSRDLDFSFESRREAKQAAEALKTVLLTHRLKGSVTFRDHAWDPPRES